jgi:hypothetical protein
MTNNVFKISDLLHSDGVACSSNPLVVVDYLWLKVNCCIFSQHIVVFFHLLSQ